MIQRIQTIWFLLAAMCIFLTLKFPSYVADQVGLKEINGTETTALLFVTVAAGILPLFAVFLYKNRKLQTILGLAAIALICLIVYLYYNVSLSYTGGLSVSITAMLHLFALLFLFLALRGIRADRLLLKNSDRLR